MTSTTLRAAAGEAATADGILPATFTACTEALSTSRTWGNTFAAIPLIEQLAVLQDFIGYLRHDEGQQYPHYARPLQECANDYVTAIGHLNLRSYARTMLVNLHDAAGMAVTLSNSKGL